MVENSKKLTDDNNYIGNRIKEQRQKMQMTQQELGNKIGFSKEHIKKIESGDRKPALETVKELKKLFDVSYDYLFEGTDRKSTFHSLVENFNSLEKKEQADFLKFAIDLMTGTEAD